MTKRWIEDSTVDPKLRSLLDGQDVEPPPHAQARVWVELRDGKEADNRMWMYAAATVVAAAVAVFFLRPEPSFEPIVEPLEFAEIASIQGVVRADTDQAGPLTRASVGQRLDPGARIRTERTSFSTVDLASVGRIELSGETDIVMTEHERVQVELTKGAMLARIQPQDPKAPFTVTAGPWTVQVVGTIFQVRRIGEAHIDVKVQKGAVDITGPNTKVRLEEGERFVSSEQTAARDTAPVKRASATEVAVANKSTDAKRVQPHEATRTKSQPRAGARRRTVRRTSRAVVSAPKTTGEKAAPATKSSPTVESPTAHEAVEAPPTSRWDSVYSPRARAKSPSKSRAAKTETPSPTRRVAKAAIDLPPSQLNAPAPKDEQQQYAEAQREPDLKKKLAMFDAIAKAGGPLAEQAGLRAAYTAERLGRRGETIERYAKLQRDFPTGAFAIEAHLGLIRSLVKIRNIDRAKVELDRFLAAHPVNERKADLRFLRAEIARYDGRCAEALSDYRAAHRSRHGQDARYFEAYCLLETGQQHQGEQALRVYLKKYPKGRHAAAAKKRLGATR